MVGRIIEMSKEFPEWRESAAKFLAENLPGGFDRPGWNDNAQTAYQIGCKALAALGYAELAAWGAVPKNPPEPPMFPPRWDDVCIAVLWLAEQQNHLSYRLPDGGVRPPSIGNGFTIVAKDAPPPPPPNIAARFGLGPARSRADAIDVFHQLGLVADGAWTKQSEFLLWRTSPRNWSLKFETDQRFLAAVDNAVETIPKDIVTKISNLITVKDVQIDALISRHAEMIEEGRKKYGPKARLGSIPSRERAHSSLESMRRNDLDWVFFRRWRIDDGWLSESGAKAAIEIFHDRLAIAVRKSVMQQMHPEKPQFYQ